MCPTPPTGRYIVPTHPAEPSGGGGATAHSGLSRTGPYVELHCTLYWWWVPIMFLSFQKKLLCLLIACTEDHIFIRLAAGGAERHRWRPQKYCCGATFFKVGGAGCQLAVSRMRPMLVRLCGTIQQPHPELQRGNVVVRVAAGRPASSHAVARTGELAFLLPRLLPFFAAQGKAIQNWLC